jgi:hypothetical protein
MHSNFSDDGRKSSWSSIIHCDEVAETKGEDVLCDDDGLELLPQADPAGGRGLRGRVLSGLLSFQSRACTCSVACGGTDVYQRYRYIESNV